MKDNAGEQMVVAMKSVAKMHSDCIKLFEDLDKSLLGLKSFYNNVVTLELGSAMSARRYLAEGLIRLYMRPENEAEFLSINICFYDLDDRKFVEPIFVVARITYAPMTVDQGEKLKRGWDPWYAFLSWSPKRKYGVPITIDRPTKRETIEKVIVAAAPLFTITSLEAALALIGIVGNLEESSSQ